MPYFYDINSGTYKEKLVDNNYAILSDDKNNSYSVSDALLIAKTGLESIKISITGEVSEISNKPGYKAVYFSIKDKKASLPCLMWKNKYIDCGIDIKVGDLVEIKGKFSLYLVKGRMNFDVDSINLAGEGQLRMQVAILAKKMQNLGYTDSTRKKEIPKFSKKIGVVTSPRGAVIHDVIRTIKRRMPVTTLVFAGAAVEGSSAPKNMIVALAALEQSDVDVILLVRGGGSFEDLMPFNDESLAMKIVNCTKPIVTGIGHEPDTTICDLVSDFRASTPTAAAELVSINMTDIIGEYNKKMLIMKQNIQNKILANKQILNSIASRPVFADISQLYSTEFQSLDFVQEKLRQMLKKFLNEYEISIKNNTDKFKSLLVNSLQNYDSQIKINAAKLYDKSPLKIMSKGYAIVKDSNNKVIKSVNDTAKDSKIKVNFIDGNLDCEVKKINYEKIGENNESTN